MNCDCGGGGRSHGSSGKVARVQHGRLADAADALHPVDDPVDEWIRSRLHSFGHFHRHFCPVPSMNTSSSLMASGAGSEMVQDASPRAKVTCDRDKFQVELRVDDYQPEDLSVKTEGDSLIIAAKRQTRSDNGSGFASRQFEQKFSLPSGVSADKVSSRLSKDGVLFVTAPRSHDSLINPSAASLDDLVTSRRKPTFSYDDVKFETTLDCSGYDPEDLDVKVEGDTVLVSAKHKVDQGPGSSRVRVFEQKFKLPSGVDPDKVVSSLDRDGLLTVTAPKVQPFAAPYARGLDQQLDRVLKSPIGCSSSLMSRNVGFANDPIERDLFAAGAASGGKATILVEDGHYKILIDAKNYDPEELAIKTLGNTVLVEAKHEDKASSGHAYSSRSFSQKFTLPQGADPEAVTSSLSKDGRLTIMVPMPEPGKSLHTERLVPIKQC